MGTSVVREGKAKYLMMIYCNFSFRDPYVTIHEGGIVTYKTETEEGTVHLSNVEILWETSTVLRNPIPKIEGNAVPFKKR